MYEAKMETLQKPVEHPNFQTVWTVLQKVAERQEETDRILKENTPQIKDFNKRFGEFTNRFSEVVE